MRTPRIHALFSHVRNGPERASERTYIQPDNILCSPSCVVKVADFGLVKELQLDARDAVFRTQEGTIIGSPQFMSPEQCRAEPVDARCDIYSLGASYYCMLTGRPPFGAGTPTALMLYQCTSPTPDPREIAPEVPQACVDIVMRAMEKSPDARFGTAEEMRAALTAALAAAPSVESSFLRLGGAAQQPARRRPSEEVRDVLKGVRASLPPRMPSKPEPEPEPEPEPRGAPEPEPSAAPSPGSNPPASASSDRTMDVFGQSTVHLGNATRAFGRKRQARADIRPIDLRQTIAHEPPLSQSRAERSSDSFVRGRRPFLLAAAAALSAFGVAVAVGWPGRLLGESETPVPAVTVRPSIKVGILHSLSGTMAGVARPIVDSTLLAIDEINEQGGLLGCAIEPVVSDGKSDSDSFAEAAARLITRDKVATLFGGGHAEGRRGIRQVVEKTNHLLLYPGDYEGLEESPNIFYLGGDPSQRIHPGLRYFLQGLAQKRVFLLGTNQPESSALRAVLQDWVRDLGGKVVGERAVARGELDFSSVLRKIASAEPDLLVSTLRGDSNVALFRAWQKRDKRLQDVKTLSLALDENILTALADVDMTGSYLAASYFQAVPRRENTQFIERFRKKYGAHHVITESMEAAYSGVYLWAKAVKAAGGLELPKVRAALQAQTFEGPGLSYRFDSGNRAFRPFYLARIVPGNRIEIVEAATTPQQPQPFPSSRPRAQWESLLKRM